jgi:integrase
VRYWQARVFRLHYFQDGVRRECADFSVRIQHQGCRECFNLDTPNKTVAAERARNLYRHLVANGWEAARTEFKPQVSLARGSLITVGDFLDALRQAETGNLQSFENYVQHLRRIVAWIAEVEAPRSRFDVRQGGHRKWLSKVDAVPFDILTPERIRAWKKDYLDRIGSNHLKLKSARITVNSIMRGASSLFSPRRLRAAGLTMSNPFAEVDFERRPSVRYRSTFSVAELTAAAQAELGAEELKVFLLAAFVGLRRDEIDKLPWSAFRWEEGVLRLETTEHFAGKSAESLADVDLEDETIAIFRGYYAQARGQYVIESAITPRRTTTYRHYRAGRVFGRLCKWLRGHGVTAKCPVHALRKEFGSQVADRLGIYAASTALRHADIKVTAQHYVEHKRRITPGLGILLRLPQNITALSPVVRTGAAHG